MIKSIATDLRLVLGTMNFGRLGVDEAVGLLDEARERGIDAVNTSDTDYSGRSEEYVGKFIRRSPPSARPALMVELAEPGMQIPHDPELTPARLEAACVNSLRRLGVDEVDLVIVPRPSFRIPIEETLSGIERRILRPGLAKAFAISTFPAWLACDVQHTARALGFTPPVAEVAPYNVLDRRVENEILPNCLRWGMGVFVWAPLAQGLLAGRYEHGTPADSRAAVLGGIYRDRVSKVAARAAALEFVSLCRNSSIAPAAGAIAWTLQRPGVTGALFGPRTIRQVAVASEASGLVLDQRFLDAVDGINPAGTALVSFFNSAPWMLEAITKEE
ncbi:aldo/keto reductase [Umezawaea endophytica]|uniref:Aldo/keto reductase n=1 Tax=Umezawaea endophytica TaxID=1654476 RepID=A0A9X2VM87_9PSEU|nr:aldo/keto reductase [Umezawaea endophytica]MCS7479111.1 aldo/keto reductase [Umezawaea endophytica]